MPRGLRFLVAPNPFKGSLSGQQAAEAIAAGLGQASPKPRIILRPLADGGPGTLQALQCALGGRMHAGTVEGPYGCKVRASWLELPGRVAVLESALACGSHLKGPLKGPRQALLAHSQGLGGLLLAAKRAGMRQAWVGLGGSACTDGGTGMARALGWRFMDGQGRELALGGGGLARLASIQGPASDPLQGMQVKALCDVRSTLCGLGGAARAFAPQKGASPGQVLALEAGLKALSLRLPRGLGLKPGAGAAGGLGAGLMAFCKALLAPGADTLLSLCGIDKALDACDWVITGEGRLDAQSLKGKLPLRVAARAKQMGKQCLVVAGSIAPGMPALKRRGVSQMVILTKDGSKMASRAQIKLSLAQWAQGLQ